VGSREPEATEPEASVSRIVQRIRDHEFHPMEDGFTLDRHSGRHGVASLDDLQWRVRLLAIRDLLRVGPAARSSLIRVLPDPDPHVRHVATLALGMLPGPEAVAGLEDRLVRDPDPVVRSQAAISLGQLCAGAEALRETWNGDPNRDVRHQCSLAAQRIRRGARADQELARAYSLIEEGSLDAIRVGKPPPSGFELRGVKGETWRLQDHLGSAPLALIWIFADWCPVCHREFHELLELEEEFRTAGVRVATIQCHDHHRCRVMAGLEETESRYWFADEFPGRGVQDGYAEGLWWPHLSDPAGAVGARYGAQPLQFVVHAEWINRPTTVIIDGEGIVHLVYPGRYWGDRPTVAETLEMARTANYRFEPPAPAPKP